jgi:hypothetical protein
VSNRTQVVRGLTLSHSFLVPEPSWSYGLSLQHCRSISWRHGDKSAGVGRALGSTWTIVSPALRKKKGRCCIEFHILYYSAQFFFHTDCELCHAGRGPKRRCAFPHAAIFFFTSVIFPVQPKPGGQIVAMLQKSIELKNTRSETAVITLFLDWACLCWERRATFPGCTKPLRKSK